MKKIMVVVIVCLCFYQLKSQSTRNDVLITLFKGQKEYITGNIQQKEQSKYLTLLNFANIIRPKILGELQKLDSTFTNNSQINIVEQFSSYNNMDGVIWHDSTYYSYSYGSNKEFTVVQRLLAQLNDTARTVLMNFNNWSNSTFSANGQALGAPTDHPFFLASKVIYTSEPTTQTIGFYYQ